MYDKEDLIEGRTHDMNITAISANLSKHATEFSYTDLDRDQGMLATTPDVPREPKICPSQGMDLSAVCAFHPREPGSDTRLCFASPSRPPDLLLTSSECDYSRHCS